MNKLQNAIRRLWKTINRAQKITICSHVNADGDTIGSAIALKELILHNTKGIEVKISGEVYPRFLTFLEAPEEVSQTYFDQSLKIVVDTSTKARIWDKRVDTLEALKIDHHPNENQWLDYVSSTDFPATGELLVYFADLLGLTKTARFDEAVFIAIWTDTEGLTQRNVTDRTTTIINNLQIYKDRIIAKMSLNESEESTIQKLEKQLKTKGSLAYLITKETVSNDYLRQLTARLSNRKGFEVYFGVVKSENGFFRGSLRSKGKVDVSKIAKLFNGGGHYASAGFIVRDLDMASRYLQVVDDIVNKETF